MWSERAIYHRRVVGAKIGLKRKNPKEGKKRLASDQPTG